MEKFLCYLVGHAVHGGGMFIVYAIVALAIYLLAFIWYAFEMKKRNKIYEEQGK